MDFQSLRTKVTAVKIDAETLVEAVTNQQNKAALKSSVIDDKTNKTRASRNILSIKVIWETYNFYPGQSTARLIMEAFKTLQTVISIRSLVRPLILAITSTSRAK